MYAWLSAQIGADAASVASYFVMAVMLLAAAWLCLAFFRRLNGDNFHFLSRKRDSRVSVRDTAAVDNRRRLVLIRRDNVEHLILVGGPGDMVIEGNIMVPEAEEQGKPVHKTQTGHKNSEKAKAARNTTRAEEKAPVITHTSQAAIRQEERKDPAGQSAVNQADVNQVVSGQAERPVRQIPHPVQHDPHPPVHHSPVSAEMSPHAHHDALSNRPSSLQNGASYAPPGQRPAGSRIQINTPPLTLMDGNRPLRQKMPPDQMPLQQHASRGAGAPDMAAGTRYPQHPVRQNPINMQTAASQAARQMSSALPVANHPAAAAPRSNGSQVHPPTYQGYSNQPRTGHNTADSPGNNGSSGHANLLNGDPSAAGSGPNAIRKVISPRREPIPDLSQRHQETGFNRAGGNPGEEDFDKILQEELMRSQTGNKLASSDKK